MRWWNREEEDAKEQARKGVEVWTELRTKDLWLYVSNLGAAYNPKTGNRVGSISSEGYVCFRGRQLHRLISTAFEGPMEDSIVVHHDDHLRTNNRLDNLVRVSRVEHSKDRAHAGSIRHRSGISDPLPPDADEWVQRFMDGEVSYNEAISALRRSSSWLHWRVSRLRALRLPSFPPLTERERASAMQDAQAGVESWWRPAPDDPEWEVSNLGRVRSRLNGKVKTFRKGRYPRFRSMGVHQAVMRLYGPPAPSPGALVRHFPDPDYTNCSLANLRWGDAIDNAEDSIVQGLLPRGADHPLVSSAPPSPPPKTPGRGKHHSHLSDMLVRDALLLCAEHRWTGVQLAKHLGISQPTASQILNGQTWRHVPRPPGLKDRRRKAVPRQASTKTSEYLWALADEVREGRRCFADRDILLTRDELLGLPPDVREREIAPALFALLRAHVERWGWFYPEASETLKEALQNTRAHRPPLDRLTLRHLAGVDYLKARMRSFWEVDGGPVKSFEGDTRLRHVIRYRLGLNNSKPYIYTLRDGTRVEARETFDITLAEIRRGFIVQRAAVSFFRPTVAAAVYALLEGNDRPSVWDPSCGFGARLLAFAAMHPGGIYYGHEPARRTFADLRALASDLPVNTVLFDSGSETAAFARESLDLVFTSPPYFDLERYYDEPGQCWRDYPTLEQWTKGYLEPTLASAFHGLRKGAPLVLNVDEKRREVVTATAERVGFQLEREIPLVLGRDVLNGRSGRTEPVFIFRRPV